jgi:hypothetical protein
MARDTEDSRRWIAGRAHGEYREARWQAVRHPL